MSRLVPRTLIHTTRLFDFGLWDVYLSGYALNKFDCALFHITTTNYILEKEIQAYAWTSSEMSSIEFW